MNLMDSDDESLPSSIDYSQNEQNNDDTLLNKYQDDHDYCLNYLDELKNELINKNNLAEKLIQENNYSKINRNAINESYDSIMTSLEMWENTNNQLEKNNKEIMNKIVEINNLIENNNKNNDILIKMINKTKLNKTNLQDLARESAYKTLSTLPRKQRKEIAESLGPWKTDLFQGHNGGKKKSNKRYKKQSRIFNKNYTKKNKKANK